MSLKIRSAIVSVAIALSVAPAVYTFAQTSRPNLSRSQYREIEVATFIQRNNLNEIDPYSIAQQLFKRPESLEGRQQEGIKIKYGKDNAPTVVEYTIIGLGDDSVRGIRTRLEMEWQEDGWKILWVGDQFQCREGRGQQDWSGKLCL